MVQVCPKKKWFHEKAYREKGIFLFFNLAETFVTAFPQDRFSGSLCVCPKDPALCTKGCSMCYPSIDTSHRWVESVCPLWKSAVDL